MSYDITLQSNADPADFHYNGLTRATWHGRPVIIIDETKYRELTEALWKQLNRPSTLWTKMEQWKATLSQVAQRIAAHTIQ